MSLVISVIVLLVIAIAAVWWLRSQFPALAHQALQAMGEDFLKLAKGSLDLERQKGLSELESKRQAVEHAVSGLEEQLKRYETLVKGFESDRDRKYGKLEGELARVVKEADQLQRTTANLVAILGNSRVRGQWGQKMAEDILRFCGLEEGIQYRREQEIAVGRPDYTFVLPDDHHLFMDVKFPLENYLKFIEAGREDDQRRYQEAFIKDVRDHLREMERRDYLAQSDRALDYLLIFIPNEQVYGLVNEWIPNLIDECLHKKIILCGPWTLYAMVRIICQAWQNYRYSLAIQDIVKAINGFLLDYGKFKERFGELGELVQKTAEKYQDITTKSYQRLDTKIKRIEEYRKGQRIPEALPEPEALTVEPISSAGERHD